MRCETKKRPLMTAAPHLTTGFVGTSEHIIQVAQVQELRWENVAVKMKTISPID